jgi:hypothetical protein
MTVLAGGSAGRTKRKRPAADAGAEELPPGPGLMAAWLRLFVSPGQVTEILAPKHRSHESARPVPVAGFFDSDHLDAAAGHALALSPRSEAVYFMPNPVRPVLLGRCECCSESVARCRVGPIGSLRPRVGRLPA